VAHDSADHGAPFVICYMGNSAGIQNENIRLLILGHNGAAGLAELPGPLFNFSLIYPAAQKA
jgi:hypothetical protein